MSDCLLQPGPPAGATAQQLTIQIWRHPEAGFQSSVPYTVKFFMACLKEEVPRQGKAARGWSNLIVLCFSGQFFEISMRLPSERRKKSRRIDLKTGKQAGEPTQ